MFTSSFGVSKQNCGVADYEWATVLNFFARSSEGDGQRLFVATKCPAEQRN